MTENHASSQYNADLEAMRSNVLLMAGMVDNQFKDAINSFKMGNWDLAGKVLLVDSHVNQLEVDLDNACRHIIVKRQPTANDLRTVMATVKVITELERIGEEATKIARIAEAKDISRGMQVFNDYEAIRGIATQVGKMLHDTVSMLSQLETKSAIQLINADAEINQDFKAVIRGIVTYMMEDPHTITAALNALWVAKSIERVADHIKNIAEHVVFIVEGRDIRHTDYAAKQTQQ